MWDLIANQGSGEAVRLPFTIRTASGVRGPPLEGGGRKRIHMSLRNREGRRIIPHLREMGMGQRPESAEKDIERCDDDGGDTQRSSYPLNAIQWENLVRLRPCLPPILLWQEKNRRIKTLRL